MAVLKIESNYIDFFGLLVRFEQERFILAARIVLSYMTIFLIIASVAASLKNISDRFIAKTEKYRKDMIESFDEQVLDYSDDFHADSGFYEKLESEVKRMNRRDEIISSISSLLEAFVRIIFQVLPSPFLSIIAIFYPGSLKFLLDYLQKF
jgi:hypothetical protein